MIPRRYSVHRLFSNNQTRFRIPPRFHQHGPFLPLHLPRQPHLHAWTTDNLDGNGAGCSGEDLDALPSECNDLDTAFPGQRIASVSY